MAAGATAPAAPACRVDADLALFAEALFSTDVQPSDGWPEPSIRAAVAFRVAMMTASEIAAMVAQEFGDHPETAPARMQWCLRMVSAAYPKAQATGVIEPCPR